MERLTYKDASENWVVACNRFWNYLKLKFPAHIRGEAIDRLAAYENTGVEPSDVISAVDMGKIACALHDLNQYKELGDIDRLRELVEADKDGRCVVLPCKIDDEVYVNIMGKTLPLTVTSISWITESPTFKAMHRVQLCFIFKSEDVGKTVFLTREAAAAALKGEQHERG